MSKSIIFKNNNFLDSSSVSHNREPLNQTLSKMNEKYNSTIITSFAEKTKLKVHHGGWGHLFIVSSYRCCIIQFQGNQAPVIHNILSNLSSILSFSVKDQYNCTINGFQTWEHYIVIGSNSVDTLEPI